MPEDKSGKVESTAAANTTASAKRTYNRGRATDRALTNATAARGRGRATRTPLAQPVAAPAPAPTEAQLEEAGYERPMPVDHSYGARDTILPAAQVDRERRQAMKTAQEPEKGRKGKKGRKGSRRK